MVSERLMAERKAMFDVFERQLALTETEEDSAFYYHPSEDRIVLSHAMFWVMTQSIKGRVSKEHYFLLLRKYQEEMLEAYLTMSPQFPELLRYCNILFDLLPKILVHLYNTCADKQILKLSAILIVSSGYGGDMPDSLADEILDDMDFHFNHVKCRKIEQMLPQLNNLVEAEMQDCILKKK